MRPMTLRERVDSDTLAQALVNDDKFFSSVLDKYIEKTAAASTPAEVLRIAAQVEKEIGLSKEAALHTAWETYVRYVNPDFLKEGGKMPPQFMKKDKKEDEKGGDKDKDEKGEKGKKSFPFAKKEKKDGDKEEKGEKEEKDEDEKNSSVKSPVARELSEKLAGLLGAAAGAAAGVGLGVPGMAAGAAAGHLLTKKKHEPKTAAAVELAEKLGMKAQAEIIKEAPKGGKVCCKTAMAKDLAKALGV